MIMMTLMQRANQWLSSSLIRSTCELHVWNTIDIWWQCVSANGASCHVHRQLSNPPEYSFQTNYKMWLSSTVSHVCKHIPGVSTPPPPSKNHVHQFCKHFSSGPRQINKCDVHKSFLWWNYFSLFVLNKTNFSFHIMTLAWPKPHMFRYGLVLMHQSLSCMFIVTIDM